jgi:hypothetical protein
MLQQLPQLTEQPKVMQRENHRDLSRLRLRDQRRGKPYHVPEMDDVRL